MLYKIVANFLFLILCFNDVISQSDAQLWGNYSLSIRNKKFSYGGDTGLRTSVSGQQWNQFLVRPTVRYHFSNIFSASLATAGFTTFNNSGANIREYRLHQQLSLRWPDLSFVSFFSRMRLEQRFFQHKTTTHRFRLLAGAESPDFGFFNNKKAFYSRAIWEGFQTFDPLNEEAALASFEGFYIDSRRIHLALGYRISSEIRSELHFISQASQQKVEEEFLKKNLHILRLRVIHNLRQE